MSYGMDTPPPPGASPPARTRGQGGVYVSNTSNTADEQLLTGSGQLLYFNMREPTGSAGGVVELYDGTSTASQRICSIGLPSGVSDTEQFNDNGIPFEHGLFKHMVTGAAVVTVLLVPDIGGE